MVIADISNEVVNFTLHLISAEENIPLCGFAFSEYRIMQAFPISSKIGWGFFRWAQWKRIAYVKNQFQYILDSRLLKAEVFHVKEQRFQLLKIPLHFRQEKNAHAYCERLLNASRISFSTRTISSSAVMARRKSSSGSKYSSFSNTNVCPLPHWMMIFSSLARSRYFVTLSLNSASLIILIGLEYLMAQKYRDLKNVSEPHTFLFGRYAFHGCDFGF